MSVSDGLLNVAVYVEQLEAERDELTRKLDEVRAKLPGMVRGAYRRGYTTGRAAQRRGAVAVTNPEVEARGWVREMCRS